MDAKKVKETLEAIAWCMRNGNPNKQHEARG